MAFPYLGTPNSSVEVYLPGTRLYLLARVDRPLHALDLLVLAGVRTQAPTPATFSGKQHRGGRHAQSGWALASSSVAHGGGCPRIGYHAIQGLVAAWFVPWV
jgi:hypothetical protein